MSKRIMAFLLAAVICALSGCGMGSGGYDAVEVAVATESAAQAQTAVPTEQPLTEAPTAAATEVPEPTPAPTEEPTPEPTEATTPEPTAEPTPEPTPEPVVEAILKCRSNKVNIRTAPSTSSEIVGTVGYEDEIRVLGVEGKFYKIDYEGEVRYCYRSYFVPREETLYGYMPAWSEYKTDKDGNIVYEADGVTPVILNSELIDIRLLIPEIEIYQILGTPDNFTGIQLYMRSVPVLQLPCALKLAAAAREFAQDGYTIKIYDCYRPKSVQYIMYDIIQDSRYIANPYNSASNHNRAAAVDMTLIGPDGVELEFPTPMHTFGKIVHRESAYMWSDSQRANVDYMTEVMVNNGFKTITTEWWHFSDTDYPGYVVMDIDMRNIPMYTASEVYEMAHLERYGIPKPAIPVKAADKAGVRPSVPAGCGAA